MRKIMSMAFYEYHREMIVLGCGKYIPSMNINLGDIVHSGQRYMAGLCGDNKFIALPLHITDQNMNIFVVLITIEEVLDDGTSNFVICGMDELRKTISIKSEAWDERDLENLISALRVGGPVCKVCTSVHGDILKMTATELLDYTTHLKYLHKRYQRSLSMFCSIPHIDKFSDTLVENEVWMLEKFPSIFKETVSKLKEVVHNSTQSRLFTMNRLKGEDTVLLYEYCYDNHHIMLVFDPDARKVFVHVVHANNSKDHYIGLVICQPVKYAKLLQAIFETMTTGSLAADLDYLKLCKWSNNEEVL